jgi:hypothetical protein
LFQCVIQSTYDKISVEETLIHFIHFPVVPIWNTGSLSGFM